MPPTAAATLPAPLVPMRGAITTHRGRVPWSWAVWMAMPWATLQYSELCSGAPLTFTLRKFLDDPAQLAFWGSLNTAFNFAVGTVSSYMSDRVWTRWGRRRPFLIAGWSGVAVSLALLPLATEFWAVAALVVLFQFCQDVAKPYEPLYNEVIPAPQRGRAGTIRNVLVNLTQVVFNAVMLAQFDRQYQFTAGGSAWRLSGEMVIYWSGSVVVAAVLLFLIFRVREVRPRAAVVERFRFAKFFRDIFGERQWWFIYLLFACPQLGGLGIATFVPLFETEQLGFSKQQVGTSGAATMLLTLVCFVPLAGFLSDRVSRLRLFQVGLVGPALVNFALFLVVRHSSDHRIAFSTLLAFNALSGGLLSLLFVVWGPLVYDYVPSHRFGTVSAGFSFVSGVAGFLLLNAAGRWIKLFDPAAGSGRAALFDYSSIYVLQLLGAGVALAWTIYFQREVRRGRIIAHGQLEAAQS